MTVDLILDFLATNDYLIAGVNIISFVGFVLTVWVAFSVRSIKNRYIFRARVPDHIANLGDYVERIVEHLNDFEHSKPEVEITLASIEVELRSLKGKLDWGSEPRKQVKQTLQRIKSYNVESFESKKRLRRIHVELHKIIETLNRLREDLRWE
jgi:hypothetical protein